MKVPVIVRKVGAGIVKHSPKILTGCAVGGVVTTVVFAVRATPRAMEVMDDLECEHPGRPIPKVEILKHVGPVYLPTLGMGTATVACIIGATAIQSRRNAVLAGLYSASELALKEYQNKVVEMIGEAKEAEVHDEINRDRLKLNPVTESNVVATGNGLSLCFDTLSGRYFLSDIELVRRAQNDINHMILNEMWVSLNDLYEALGLDPIGLGNTIGWNVDHMLEFRFTSDIASDGRPCLVLDYVEAPRNCKW